jgi:predicted ABC-class ATPase
VYFEAPEAVVLIDPLVPGGEEERFWTALDRDVERLGRPVVVLLTVPWHERSAVRVVERYSGRITSEPTAGVEAIRVRGAGGEPETVFWLDEPSALVFGDIVVGTPPRVVDEWQPEERRGEPVRAELRAALGELPVERLLPSHGEPVLEGAREALGEALR